MTGRIRDHLGAPDTRAFVGAPVEVCCGWTTRPGGDRTSLEDLMARSDWAMLESREGRQAAFGSVRAAGDWLRRAAYSTRNALPPRRTADPDQDFLSHPTSGTESIPDQPAWI